MELIGYEPRGVVEPSELEFVSLEEIWLRLDYRNLYVPLVPKTKYLVNKTTLAKCKVGVMQPRWMSSTRSS